MKIGRLSHLLGYVKFKANIPTLNEVEVVETLIPDGDNLILFGLSPDYICKSDSDMEQSGLTYVPSSVQEDGEGADTWPPLE